MKMESTFTGWDFTNTWGIDPNLNNGYPYLLALKNSYYAPPLTLSPTVQVGSTMGSSTVTATPNTSLDTLDYAVSTAAIPSPPLNSAPPTGLQTSSVLSNVQVGDYVGVYEVNRQNQVVAFRSIGPLTSANIDTVNAAAPTITTPPSGETVIVGQPAIALTVGATSSDKGTQSYQWYRNTKDSNSGGTAIPNARSATYTPDVSTVGTVYYYVVVTNTNSGVNGQTIATTTSPAVAVTVNALVNAAAPTIAIPPSGETVIAGQPATSLTVGATSSDKGTLSYQWYSSTSNSNTGGTAIPNARSATYTPDVSTVGTVYYYVVVTNTNPGVNGQTTATATSPAVAATVNAAGGGLNGQLPEVPFAGGLPLLGLAGAGVLWFKRRRKNTQA